MSAIYLYLTMATLSTLLINLPQYAKYSHLKSPKIDWKGHEHYYESIVEGEHVTILDFSINTNRKILASKTAIIIKYIKENIHKDLYEGTKWQKHPSSGFCKTKQIQQTGVEKRKINDI